ncbi:MAG: shikimate dehydrogenase [Actinobacteria bacterium]|nr:shikimate dehydrogenase [Actinomycetota bacterium]
MSGPRLGVLGWPVAHSRSPQMHNAALAHLGLEHWRYQRLPVPPELFAETVRGLHGAGFRGANVTMPHKEAALAVAETATDRARAIGAANTLTFNDDGTIHADNTDAPGFLAALPAAPAAGSSALILGAGGSARAVVWALMTAGVEVAVWNRTHERAQQLAGELGAVAVRAAPPADLLVNCTSVGLAEEADSLKDLALDAEYLSRYATVADLVYRSTPTPVLAAAARAGCALVDGAEILVRQGALSLEAWTGLPAPIEVMRDAVRST